MSREKYIREIKFWNFIFVKMSKTNWYGCWIPFVLEFFLWNSPSGLGISEFGDFWDTGSTSAPPAAYSPLPLRFWTPAARCLSRKLEIGDLSQRAIPDPGSFADTFTVPGCHSITVTFEIFFHIPGWKKCNYKFCLAVNMTNPRRFRTSLCKAIFEGRKSSSLLDC